MGSGAIDPTGFSGLGGLMGRGMPDDMIHSFAERPVGGRFEVKRTILPMAKSGKGLHVDPSATIDVGGTGGFLYDPNLASVRPPGPELATHFVDGSQSFKGIDRDLMYGRAGASRFGLNPKMRPFGGFARCTVISIYEQVTQHFPIVINEPGSNVFIFYKTTSQNG